MMKKLDVDIDITLHRVVQVPEEFSKEEITRNINSRIHSLIEEAIEDEEYIIEDFLYRDKDEQL